MADKKKTKKKTAHLRFNKTFFTTGVDANIVMIVNSWYARALNSAICICKYGNGLDLHCIVPMNREN